MKPYFDQNNETNAPDALITTAAANSTAVRFGIEDLSVYVLAYYKTVIDIPTNSDGVKIRRVRVRANAFHCSNDAERSVPWEFHGGGYNPLVKIDGANFEINECDFWSTWSLLKSGGAGAETARFGIITNNTFWTGGACHWFNQAKQILFERNTCTGNNPDAMGSNIDTYGGGFAHHIYLGSSVVRQVWGNDREVMTYDNAGQAYYGKLDAATAATGNVSALEGDGFVDWTTRASYTSVAGGSVIVLNGTGAGQYRRIVNYEVTNTSAWFSLEAPFDVAPEEDAVVQVQPHRGSNIFFEMHYEDVGAFQFYGIGVDNLIVSCTMARGGGFVGWGQWRQNANFSNVNLKNQYLGNEIVEGARAEHQSTPLASDPDKPWGDPLQVNGGAFSINNRFGSGEAPDPTYAADWLPQNELDRLIIFRGNTIRSNAGFYIGAATDVLLEGNTVADTPTGSFAQAKSAFAVDATAVGVLLVNNTE